MVRHAEGRHHRGWLMNADCGEEVVHNNGSAEARRGALTEAIRQQDERRWTHMCRLTLYVYGGRARTSWPPASPPSPISRISAEASRPLRDVAWRPTADCVLGLELHGDAPRRSPNPSTRAMPSFSSACWRRAHWGPTDPDRADLFVLPEPYGTATGVGLGLQEPAINDSPVSRRAGRRAREIRKLLANPWMPYLTDATAASSRRVCSTVVEWCPTPTPARRVINLGDDDVQST